MKDDGGDLGEQRARNHTMRAAILNLLASNEEELTPEQIMERLPNGPTQHSLSYHLRVLGDHELVTFDTDGYRLV